MTRLTLLAVVMVCAAVAALAQEPPLRGFSGKRAAEQRDLEKKFRAAPQAKRLCEYMSPIAAKAGHGEIGMSHRAT